MSFQVGDRIRVKASQPNRDDLWNEEGEVVITYSSQKTVIVVLPNHRIHDFPQDYQWFFDYADTRIEKITSGAVTTTNSKPQEGSCQICGRTNDLNVKVCYWCGSIPF